MPIKFIPETRQWELYDCNQAEWEELIRIGKEAFMQYFAADVFKQMAQELTPEQIREQQMLEYMKIANSDDLPQA